MMVRPVLLFDSESDCDSDSEGNPTDRNNYAGGNCSTYAA